MDAACPFSDPFRLPIPNRMLKIRLSRRVRISSAVKAVILAGRLGHRISEETTTRPKPMVELGGRPVLWHIMRRTRRTGSTTSSSAALQGYVIKEFFANYALHASDVTFDMRERSMRVHSCAVEPWKVTLVDTGDDTMTGGRLCACGAI